MKVLLVSHLYPPLYRAGVEVYTEAIAGALRDRGHDVTVFATVKDIARPDLEVTRRAADGVTVFEVTNNLFYRDFRETFSHSALEERFSSVLDEARPDVVHFMHLLYLSLGCAGQVASRGIPAFYSMHDFWLQCARFGQRMRADGEICHEIEAATCARCIATMKFAQSPLERRLAKTVMGVRQWTGIDLGRPLRALRRSGQAADRVPQEPSTDSVAVMAARLAERDRMVRTELASAVTTFVAPSRFLAEELRRWGLDRQKIKHLRTGIDVRPFDGFQRASSSVLRIAYAGTIVPHKGAHVVLDAWERLPRREGVELRLYGRTDFRPEYVRRIREQAARCGAILAGEFPHTEIVRVLSEVDVLIIPSIWYENSPFTILEAQACATPLVVSDLGGMKELVEEGVSGFRFRPGDVGDLARVLGRIVRAPAVLESLYPEGPIFLRTLEDDVGDLEREYRDAREGARA